jgi:hypothetical protein
MTQHPIGNDSQLLIRCPSCGQRFKVGHDFRGRTVECGGCDHRFRIDDDVTVRSKKVYPGERREPALNQFPRIPLASGGSLEGMAPLRPNNLPDPAVIEPVSPLRVIAGIVGVAVMIMVGLILMTGGTRNGPLEGVVFSSRLVMAGFASLLGVTMLAYASPKARGKALVIGSLLASLVMAVPFFFFIEARPLVPTAAGKKEAPAVAIQSAEDATLAEMRARIGTGPLVAEIERLKKVGSKKRAFGLWVRGLNGGNRYLLENYIMQTTHADYLSHFFPRENGEYLFVVTGITQTLQELAATASILGNTEKIYPDLSVIQLVVENDVFVESPMEKLSNKEDPEFYHLNKRELGSIEFGRVKRAVQRLAEVKPKLFRDDITRRLISLLGDDEVDFKDNICKALSVWSEKPGPASEAALEVVKKLHSIRKTVPPELIALIIKEKNLNVIPILNELWLDNARVWESLYGDIGQPIEATICGQFPKISGFLRYSAVRLLGRVGGSDSLAVINAAVVGNDPEYRVLVDNARKSITERLSK